MTLKTLVKFLAQSRNMGFFTDTFPVASRRDELPALRRSDPGNFKAMLPFGRRVRGRRMDPITQPISTASSAILAAPAAAGIDDQANEDTRRLDQ